MGVRVRFQWQTKYFSSWGAGLFSVLWILIFASIMQIFFPTEMMDMGISIAGESKLLFFHQKNTIFRCRCLFTIYYLRYPYDYASPITRRIHFCCNQSLLGHHQLILAHSQNAFPRSTLKIWNFLNFFFWSKRIGSKHALERF